jgi:hypothetical protein
LRDDAKIDPFSHVMWAIRSDRIGKYLLIATWAWLTYHFLIKPMEQ